MTKGEALAFMGIVLCVVGSIIIGVVATSNDNTANATEAATTAQGVVVTKIYSSFSFSVYRMVDTKQGNVIYVLDGGTSDGLVVVPMEDR